jgi:transposase InsO family protein/transposase-like protein
VAKTLGLAEQTLDNWVKVAGSGGLTGVAAPKVSAEHMEISRLQAELVRVKMERGIVKMSGGVLRQEVAVKYAFSPATSGAEAGFCPMYGAWRQQLRFPSVRATGTLPGRVLFQSAPGRGHDASDAHQGDPYRNPRGLWLAPDLAGIAATGRSGRQGTGRRMMHDHAIRARSKRTFKATADSNRALPVSDNLLNRAFRPDEPHRAWAGDITYIATQEGWLYLAVVINLFSRQVVGWALGERMTRQLVIDALTMAWFRRRPAKGLIFYSDQGSQYASADFLALLRRYAMRGSMSRRGNCWDNAVTEPVHSTLGYASPMAFEVTWRRQQPVLPA